MTAFCPHCRKDVMYGTAYTVENVFINGECLRVNVETPYCMFCGTEVRPQENNTAKEPGN